jgi:hypothetical protein
MPDAQISATDSERSTHLLRMFIVGVSLVFTVPSRRYYKGTLFTKYILHLDSLRLDDEITCDDYFEGLKSAEITDGSDVNKEFHSHAWE